MKNQKILAVSLILTSLLVFIFDNSNIGLFDNNSSGFIFIYWGIPLLLSGISLLFNRTLAIIILGAGFLFNFIISIASHTGNLLFKIIGFSIISLGIIYEIIKSIEKINKS